MSPDARATAVAVFSSALYLGQTLGVALAAPVIDALRRAAHLHGRGDGVAGADILVLAPAAAAGKRVKIEP